MEDAVEAMQEDESLWKCYCDNVAQHKLHLPPEMALLTRQILHEYIGIDTFDCEDALSKLISFHVRLHVHNLDIAKVARLLEPISKLETKSLSLHPDPTTPFAQTSVVSPEYIVGQKRLPNISLFIVAKLFGAFSEAASTTSTDKLTQWHRSYLGIVSLQFKFWQASMFYGKA